MDFIRRFLWSGLPFFFPCNLGSIWFIPGLCSFNGWQKRGTISSEKCKIGNNLLISLSQYIKEPYFYLVVQARLFVLGTMPCSPQSTYNSWAASAASKQSAFRSLSEYRTVIGEAKSASYCLFLHPPVPEVLIPIWRAIIKASSSDSWLWSIQ
jgi:hypothetical protein